MVVNAVSVRIIVYFRCFCDDMAYKRDVKTLKYYIMTSLVNIILFCLLPWSFRS